jgi:hypothetical protein
MSCTGIGKSDANNYLEPYQWKNRLILIFASSQQDSTLLKTQQQAIAYKDEIADRDLLLMYMIEKGKNTVNGSLLPDSVSTALRKEYAVPQGKFTIILIGKDGGEKMRQENKIDFKEIFGRIDAMPMRQSEMQERSPKK